MTNKMKLMAMVGVLGLSGGLALAQAPPGRGPQGPPDRRPGMGFRALTRELGLSDAQVAQIEKMRTDQRRAGIKRRADVELARLELRELLKAPTIDEKAVQARTKELGDLHAAGLRARVDAQVQMNKILTPEQRSKLEQMRQSRPPRPPREGRGGRSRRLGPPPGPGDDEEDEPLTGVDGR